MRKTVLGNVKMGRKSSRLTKSMGLGLNSQTLSRSALSSKKLVKKTYGVTGVVGGVGGIVAAID